MKRILSILLFIFSSHLFAEPLIIGTMSYDPPYEQQINNKNDFTGFDIEIMNAICKRINRECRFKAVEFSDLLTELNAGQIDLAISAISITKERKKKALFSLPYFVSEVQFMALKSTDINSIKGLKGNKIGILEGSSPLENFINDAYGVNANKIVTYAKITDLIQALADKKINLVLMDAFYAEYWLTTGQSPFKTIGKAFPLGIGYGIMTTKNNQSLIAEINKALIEIEADGTYIEIYSRYFN